MTGTTTLRRILSCPLVLRSEAIQAPDGFWLHLVSYPEIELEVGRPSLIEAVRVLEERAVAAVLTHIPAVAAIANDRESPPNPCVETLLVEAGLSDLLPLVDRPFEVPESQVREPRETPELVGALRRLIEENLIEDRGRYPVG